MDDATRRFVEERLLTTREAAALLGVPVATVKQWAGRHKLDWVMKGNSMLFDREDVTVFQRPGIPGKPGRRAKSGGRYVIPPAPERP